MRSAVERIVFDRQNAVFITVKTDNVGVSASNQFQLSFGVRGSTIIDWGDGAFELPNSDLITHTYPSTGTYKIKLYGFTLVPTMFWYDPTFITSGTRGKDGGKIIAIEYKTKKAFISNQLDWNWANLNMSVMPFINTQDVTGFYAAFGGSLFTSFPFIDTSQVTQISLAWISSLSLNSFPLLNFSKVLYANSALKECISLSNLPSFDFSNLVSAPSFVENCTNLVNFPSQFNNCNCVDFTAAFNNCALNQTSVDGILTSINSKGLSNGNLGISGGTNSTPSTTGRAAADALRARGWTVTLNGY